jgi:hypothetical protein
MTPFPRSPSHLGEMENTTTYSTTTGKRKYNNAFVPATYEDARYGNHLKGNYFLTNRGHDVYDATHETISEFNQIFSKEKMYLLGQTCDTIEDLVAWCENYLKASNK